MKRRDLGIIRDRMERINEIIRDMVGESDEIKLKDMRLEIAGLVGGTKGIVDFYLTLED